MRSRERPFPHQGKKAAVIFRVYVLLDSAVKK